MKPEANIGPLKALSCMFFLHSNDTIDFSGGNRAFSVKNLVVACKKTN